MGDMQIMSLMLSNGMVICGAGLLCLALVPIQSLIRQLPASKLKQRWQILRFLIYFFILGYSAYALGSWKHFNGMATAMVPIIFLLGSIFVLLVGNLAVKTASDVQKIADCQGDNITDPLTGTYNYRYLDQRLSQEFDRARRYWLPLSVIMFEIDHLQKVSGLYGHKAGDRVLAHVGQLLLQQVRNTDIVAHYGKAAFAIITPHTRLPDAEGLAERLRVRVADTPIELPASETQVETLKITASMGLASNFEGVTDAELLIRMANDALYVAKKNGRNQVVVCDEERCRGLKALVN